MKYPAQLSINTATMLNTVKVGFNIDAVSWAFSFLFCVLWGSHFIVPIAADIAAIAVDEELHKRLVLWGNS